MAALPEPDLVLSFEEARHLVESHAAGVRPHGKELAESLDAAGQILAEPIFADRNFPPFRRATRDGYALRAADLGQLPATLEVVGEIKAGASLAESGINVGPGQAALIMTGAPVPRAPTRSLWSSTLRARGTGFRSAAALAHEITLYLSDQRRKSGDSSC